MEREKFIEWLISERKMRRSVAETRASSVIRIDNEFGIDSEFVFDQCATLLEFFEYSKKEYSSGELPLHGIFIDGNQYTGTATLKQSLKLYIDYKKATSTSCLTSTAVPATSAKFIGSFDDFNHYLGGYCRNKVNIITKSSKKRLGCVCEYCKKKGTSLDAAHKTGQERPVIIKRILEAKYKLSVNYYEVNLDEFEKLFIDAQNPANDHFYFLCKDCHTKYDNGVITPAMMRKITGR